MKVLITGAHFTPAQAVIEQLQTIKGIEIVYVGRKTTMEGDSTPSAESQLLPKLGVKFVPIVAGRLRRFVSLGTIISLLKRPVGFIQAFWVVLTEEPDVVVSFGGYVAVPVVVSAWFLNVPIIIHEQTLVSGLANTISSFFADKIAVAFDKDYSFPKRKVFLTGNPIRNSILNPSGKVSAKTRQLLKLKTRQKLPLLVITGGNQGSHFFNQLLLDNLDYLVGRYLIVHQSGDSKFKDFEKLSERRNSLKHPERYFLYKFIDGEDLGAIFQAAELVISRAGANTLLELAYLGTPTLIVPIPYLHNNEQEINAKFFAGAGLGEVIYQSELTGPRLLGEIERMVSAARDYRQKAQKAKSVVILDAAQKITRQILILGKYNG